MRNSAKSIGCEVACKGTVHEFSGDFTVILKTFVIPACTLRSTLRAFRSAQSRFEEDLVERSSLKSIAAATLPAALAVIVTQACTDSTSAQPTAATDPIEGVWNSQVTITNCQTGAIMRQFAALNLFIHGGSLVDTDTQPPASHGAAFGTWLNSNGPQYASTFELFRFNADGSFAGTNKVARTITLSAGGAAFTSSFSVTVEDPEGATLSTACGTETATRAA
jgi:hypothetical protein